MDSDWPIYFRSLRLGFFDLDGFGEQPESWSTLMRRVVLLEDTRAWNWCCQYDANILHIKKATCVGHGHKKKAVPARTVHIPLRYVEHLILFLYASTFCKTTSQESERMGFHVANGIAYLPKSALFFISDFDIFWHEKTGGVFFGNMSCKSQTCIRTQKIQD